jgi:hypothetical protein
MGLSSLLSDFSVNVGNISGGISQRAFRNYQPTFENTEKRYLYIGLDHISAKLAKVFDIIDHKYFGRLMGYPQCCIESYPIYYPTKKTDFTFAIKKPETGCFSFLLNLACKCFDYSLISHFPCSWSCKKSLSLAKQILSALDIHDKEETKKTVDFLKSDVFYANDLVISFRKTTINKKIINLNASDFKVSHNIAADSLRMNKSTAHLYSGSKKLKSFQPYLWLPFKSKACHAA